MLKLKKLIRKMVVWINNNLVLETYTQNDFTIASGFAAGVVPPLATKRGRIVTLDGMIKTTAQQSTGVKTIGRVPLGCEPLYIQQHVIQTSGGSGGMNRILTRVYPDGHMIVERYGINSNIAIPANTSFFIPITYISKK